MKLLEFAESRWMRFLVACSPKTCRALVVGFQTRAEAQAFCDGLKGDCFVR